MLQSTDIQPCFVSMGPRKIISDSPNIVFLQCSNSSTASTDVTSTHLEENLVSKGQNTIKKDIYVCTFCQVFSPHLTTVSDHISDFHAKSLPAGTKPEDFVSKLQSLDENYQKKRGKRGRPKKTQIESTISKNSKQEYNNPIPDSEGLFWCKTCLKYFRKSRQLMQHICFDLEDELSSEESSIEFDDDTEFRTYMNIDPSPWSRIRKNRKLKENSTDEVSYKLSSTEGEKIVENKVIPNWRKDPAYIPLFDNEKEKAAFEEHLKSIDYSFVDNMFKIIEKNKNKKNYANSSNVIFSCDFCKKECKSLSHIRAHCLIHTDTKPFTCLKCSYRTNSSGSLYFHMRKHTGNVFWCSSCDFKCMKRSHLLDHEATHTAEYQICKLCKNSYKTLKSLINHVRKYHDHPNGKKYMKLLTCKQNKFICSICNKKFKTLNILNNHNHACHENIPPPDTTPLEESISEQNSENMSNEITDVQMQINGANSMETPIADLQCSNLQTKDPLAEMVLNDFLQQQQQSQSIMYQNVFSQSNENMISSSNDNILSNLKAKAMAERLATETSILEECQKTLNLDILEECLQNRFSNQCEEFGLIPNISRKHSLQPNSENNSDVSNHLAEISDDKLEEPKSVEIKLFEKCQRAPAYVCCVCSSIYICPSTLKAHLKEHVNSSISSFMDQAEEQQFETAATKVTETNNELDVCEILQDSSESFSFDKELEKLYTSSLDLMYYLPEVSVVLENDAALFDTMLDDISNFPINDNSSQDLNEKVEEENVLKMFS